MKDKNQQEPIISVELVIRDNCLPTFSPLLQQGVMIPLDSKTILRPFLYHNLGLSPDFVEQYLTTVFINGKPVDNLDQATLRNGDTLALSGAMPGLVGATMRRQGLVASFRSSISHREEERRQPTSETHSLVLKLFNLMIEAAGPALLNKGVFLTKGNWEQFLQSKGLKLWSLCRRVRINAQEVNPSADEPFPWGENVSLIKLIISCD